MKPTVIKLDSTQFSIIKSKVDTLLNLKHDTCSHSSITNNTVFNSKCDDSSSFWLFILQYLVAPAIIVFISVWLTNYTGRNKEYNRIKKLNAFINVWLTNIIAGLNEQIQLFKDLRKTYDSIEFDTPRNFAFANVDIKGITDLPKADLHKLFISIRKGDESQKSQNFYDLLFALNSAQEIIQDYRQKSTELNKRTIKMSDDGFEAFKKLIDAEKEYANIHIQAATQNPNYRLTPAFLASQQYSQMAIARQNYLQTAIGKTRTRRAVYFFSKMLAAYCAKNLHVDQNLFPLLELNNNVFQAIFQLREYYSKIRNNIDAKIKETERMRDLISANQTYFNNLKFVSKLRFKD